MRTHTLLLPSLLAAVCACGERIPPHHFLAPTALETAAYAYPAARKGDQVDEYHGYHVSDPYRWLEDPDAAETRIWIEAQNELTQSILGGIAGRDGIHERLSEVWDYEKRQAPNKRGGRYFFRRNDGLLDQSILYVSETWNGRARVLLDPNELSSDGTIALSSVVPSHDGKLLAFGLSDGGSDWREWHVLEVGSGRRHADVIHWNKFGGLEWAADGAGFFYMRFDRPAQGEKLQELNAPPDVCYHRLGTPEEEDVVLIARAVQPGIFQGFTLTSDRRAMIVSRRDARSQARNSELDFVPLTPPAGVPNPGWRVRTLEASSRPEVIALVSGYDAKYQFIGGNGERIWVQTNLNAPRGRVLAIDPRAPERANWTEVVPEGENAIQSVNLVGGRLIVSYLVHARSQVEVHDTSGTHLYTVELPGLGTVSGFGGEAHDPETFFSFASYTTPERVFRYDVEKAQTQLYASPEVDFDAEDYETRQVFFESRDGTRIPMFLTHKKNLALDGSNPTYLYGYGGFNISITPSFSAANAVWLEMGGVLAVPSLRGGGEYGESWHVAGTKLQKQNVFDDFIAAAEWLIDNDYTNSRRLAIGGGSNGGLLVGACMTQRPDLFAAALPAVGVLDMLRYHRFTIGWAWAGDYGTSDDPDEFRALFQYSPLHNLHRGTDYPATLITTGDHDDRVVPAHSFKFAATLQQAHVGRDPVLIRIETRAGHGAGKPTWMRIEQAADRWAFLARSLDMDL